MDQQSATAERILVIAGLGRWTDGTRRTEKIQTHVLPMTDAAERVTYLTIGPTPTADSDLDTRRLRPSGIRFLDFLRLCIAGIRLARSDQYDVIATFSLVPYGLFGLIATYLSGRPVHLGIIGMDLDVHATGLTGPFVRWAFRRFDAISIAGSSYRDRLQSMGVDADRVHTILHPVSTEYASSTPAPDPTYDLVWVGRMSPEKDPERFVSIVEALHARGCEVTAVMVGDGPIFDRVSRTIDDTELREYIDLAGWQSRPVEFYRQSRLYVLTSEREMLPLTVVESMLVGRPVVAPRIGAIPDIVDDKASGYIVESRTPDAYADIIQDALADPHTRKRVGEQAKAVEAVVSPEAVAESWRDLFTEMTPRPQLISLRDSGRSAELGAMSRVHEYEDSGEKPDHSTDGHGELHPFAPRDEIDLRAGDRNDRSTE